jgi:hypothetical protein
MNTVESFLAKARKVAKGDTLEAAGIEHFWLSAYATIARRCRDDREFGVSRYPYEQGPGVGPFSGGFFEHREWPVRRGMERHPSLRPICEYESNYVNAAGYWLSFNQSALALRDECLGMAPPDTALAERYDIWAIIAVRYSLRVLGLRVEFYRRAAKDPVHAKLVMPALESRNEISATDDLDEAIEKLDGHMATQLMKAVATLSANNAVKRQGDGSAGAQ